MLKIKLKKTGRKKNPTYRIIILENLSKRDGNATFDVGYYDPIKKKIYFKRINLYNFLNYGAYPTNTVRHLIYKSLKN